MSPPRRFTWSFGRAALYAALSLASPLAAHAQQTPASSSSSASVAMEMGAMDLGSMDMGSMHGMHMPAGTSSAPSPATVHPTAGPTGIDQRSTQGMNHDSMPGMQHGMDHGAMRAMQHGSMQGMDALGGMSMGPMQGGNPPPDARSPDYSDGVGRGPAHGPNMDMDDNARIGMLLLDQLEAFHGKNGNGQRWEAEGWYGNPSDKLWLRTEGERSGGRLEDGDIEAFWNHNVSAYWSTQLGARHDLSGPSRDWAAFGFQGLAPYWFEIEATAYAGPTGRTAARFRAEYELLFTQQLVLQPEFETNLYGKSDRARGIGSGLSDASLGLRLRYEIRRQFAPYVGVVWTRRFGATAGFARDEHQPILDRQWVAGVRLWF